MKTMDIIHNPFKNKGTAFTEEERRKLGLIGTLPGSVQTIEQQAKRVYDQYKIRPDGMQKRKFLMEVFNTNRTLFYYVLSHHIEELLPIVYDPVIAPAIEQYSEIFMLPQEAAFLSIEHPEDIEESLKNAADGRDNATKILNKYRNEIPVFNDDVQGTGIVSLAGVLGALEISGQKITDQRFLTFGAGTAGMGIANLLCKELQLQGLSEEEAKKHFYLVDKQGLLFDDTEGLTPEQKPFTRSRDEFDNSEELTNLEAVIKAVHPTVMIGTSTTPGAFTEGAIREMAAHTERPIIFPISNPTRLIEAMPKDLLEWTDGKALIATGIPVEDVEYKGVSYAIGQANNALIYPGVGLGVLASKARLVNDQMISAAAHSLGGIVDTTKPGAAVLPPVSKIHEFTKTVAKAVAQSAIDQGLADPDITDAEKAIEAIKWEAKY